MHRNSMTRMYQATLVCWTTLALVTAQSLQENATYLQLETPLLNNHVPCGSLHRFVVDDLHTSSLYDVKISHPASNPAAFEIRVEDVRIASRQQLRNKGGKDELRRLDTTKLRLHPQEWVELRNGTSDGESTFRLGLQQEIENAGLNTSQGVYLQVEFSVDVQPRGVEPPSARKDRTRGRICTFDIAVERMILGAFPISTVPLIVWIVVLLVLVSWYVFSPLMKILQQLQRNYQPVRKEGRE